MNVGRANRVQLALVLAVLVLLHFYVRPRLWSARVSPDFLLMALVFFSMRAGPGAGAVVGYLVAWARAVFFADNLAVYAAFVAGALWLRDLVLLVASGTYRSPLLAEVTLYSPLQALTTALFTLLILAAFREWFAIRLDL
jgi:hypothetical protein